MTMTPPMILASTSPHRRAQMARLGLDCRAVAPGVDEEAWTAGFAGTPRDLAEALAVAKAESVAAAEPGAIVVAGDQVVEFDGLPLGKPGSLDAAVDQLRRMSGREHALISAVAVAHAGRVARHVEVSRLRLRDVDRAAVARAVAADRSWDCAGGYKVEGRCAALFDRVETADPSAIIGLPIVGLVSILRGLGLEIP